MESLRVPALPDATDPELDMYQYQPLPGPGYIRLLKFLPGFDDIHCSLETVHLGEAEDFEELGDTCPPYNALSYTWNDPRPGETAAVEECFPFACNGKTMMVAANLYAAMHQIRNILAKSDGPDKKRTTERAARQLSPDGDDEHHGWPTEIWIRQKYFWIDAICINQKDLNEKSRQIRQMGAIYTTANTVLVWLGKADDSTETAVDVMSQLSSVPRGLAETFTGLDIWNPEAYAGLGMPMIGESQWEACTALLHRRWFNRSWILQEVTLARYIAVLCGPYEISWQALVATSHFLTGSAWWEFSGVLTKHIRPSSHGQGSTSYIPMASNLERGRGLLHASKDRLSRLDILPLFEALLHLARNKEAGDARDKVYAVLGIVHNSSSVTNPSRKNRIARIMVPDYKKSVQEVYLDATMLVLDGTRDLRFLSAVEERSIRQIAGLPSWVPDYSALPWPRLFRVPLLSPGETWKWCTAGLVHQIEGEILVRNPLPATGCLLTFAGAHIDTVAGFADSQVELADNHTWVTLILVALESASSKIYSDGLGITEVLWRTMLANTFHDQYPAPPNVGIHFRNFIFWNLQILRQAAKSALREASMNIYDLKVQHLVQLFKATLSALESLAEMDRECIFSDQKELIFVLNTIRDRRSERSHQSFKSCFKYSQAWDLTYYGRRLFRTRTGYLGLGPQSLRVGDEVWISCSSPTPLLLRPIAEGRHEFMGEAYVHGIMHGEAIKQEEGAEPWDGVTGIMQGKTKEYVRGGLTWKRLVIA
ncbi:hypothetical protein MMC30_005142 [Trapelia coarctata]|nr:hypothetical protein [Trapelia coarctata]